MKDPYSLLGVSRDATDEQVKAAYRELARKFHPDNFSDNPAAAEMATEKMQEINEAYDTIMNKRSRKGGHNTGNTYSNSGSSNFVDVRSLISGGRFEEAQEILDGVPVENRDAEWYFLNGCVLYRRGWFDSAFTSVSTACRMDPTNPEYRAMLNQLHHSRNGYASYGYGRSRGMGSGPNGECTMCDLCAGLACLDCMCDCI